MNPLPRVAAALLATAALVRAAAESAAAPVVAGSMSLSALPAAQSSGAGGPVNRVALDVAHFGPESPDRRLECIYPGALRYRCHYEFAHVTLAAPLVRIEVQLPDLDRGAHVLVRLANGAGSTDFALELVNPPQVVHQIEGLALPEGGRTLVGADGKPAPVLSLASAHLSTVPTLAVAAPALPDPCERLIAKWESASATDSIFTSRFGPLTGTVILEQPVVPGALVSAQSAPRWLVTYAAGAARVQFIAHYEVSYRVSPCPTLLIR